LIYFVAFLSGVVFFHLHDYFPLSAAALFLPAAMFFFRRGRRAALALLVLGALYPALRDAPGEGLPFRSGSVNASGHFSAPAVELRKGFAQDFELAGGGGRIEVHSDEPFEIGREFELNLRIISPYPRNNPGALPPGQFAVLGYVRNTGDLSRSVSFSFNRLRDRLNRAIAGRFDPETASLVMAVTTGHRASMSYSLKDDFRRSGLAHLLSISGTHFGLLFLLLFGAFRAAMVRLPMGALERLTVYLTPSQAAALLCLPFLLLYLGISGMRVPTVRSFVMISLFLFGLLVGRKGTWLNFLVLAALALVLWDPGVMASLSFQLSFLAVLFIGFFLSGGPAGGGAGEDFGPEEEERKGRRLRAALRYPVKSFGITFAATLGVAPLIAHYFNYLSLISPVSNLVVTPLVCMVLVPFSVLGSFVYLATGSFVFAPLVSGAAGAATHLVGAFASVPYASVPVPAFPPAVLIFYYAGFLVYFVTRQRGVLLVPAAAVLVPLAVAASSGGGLAVTFLDAGRGDASVVELPDGKVLAVDTGSRGWELRRYLRHRGIEKIDVLVLTHQDHYHVGGAGPMAWQYDVGEVWDNGAVDYPEDFPRGPARKSLKRGDSVEGEGYAIEVLHPPGGCSGRRNDCSLVMKVTGERASFLFLGDIGPRAMRELLPLGEKLKSDVARFSDHGTWEEAHGEFVEAVSPDMAYVRGRSDEGKEKYLTKARVIYSYGEGAAKAEGTPGGLRVRTYVGDARLVKADGLDGELENVRKLFAAW
jgi:competence protein ComEC